MGKDIDQDINEKDFSDSGSEDLENEKEVFEEKRRPGYEDRRKALRDLIMSRPRRKDEMIH